MKVFSIASALDSNKYTPNSVIDIGKGYLVVDKSGHVVRDEHATGLISLRTILQKSSNVGVAKMTLSLPPEQLWSLLHRVGFGEKTQSHFPGERDGSLVNHRVWRPITLATLAFGYGISVTTLQLAHAYAVIADDGKKIPITLLRREETPAGVQAIDSKVANQMLQMLQYVVETGGTGTKAQVPGYHVAGKTGTARIAGNHGYSAHHHVGSFVGIAPIANPRLVVAVVISDPHKISYYGGIIAAPVFSQVMGGALRILGVPPDNIATLTSNQKGS
jgi:cell division protein FtsI (penicillin-binding protein 3)